MKRFLMEAPFRVLAERTGALYCGNDDTLRLAMLGQEYHISKSGVTLQGQRAPENHEAIILDYLLSSGRTMREVPWRSFADFGQADALQFRKTVELPLIQHVSDFITRASTIVPLFDAVIMPSMIGSDMAITIRALPKVHLRMELSLENQEFPSDAWILISNNANEFLSVDGLHRLGELCKDRILSLLRIY
jgi:hypothetical protein